MADYGWQNTAFIKLSIEELLLIEAKLGLARDNVFPPESWPVSLHERIKQAKEVISTKKAPTVFDRLDQLDLGQATAMDNIPLQGLDRFEYSWQTQNPDGAGYEKLVSKNKPHPDRRGSGGGHEYSGVYHPDVVCETVRGDGGPGICRHCGTTNCYQYTRVRNTAKISYAGFCVFLQKFKFCCEGFRDF